MQDISFTPESLPEFDNHILISSFFDEITGLKGFIAIHNTNLGPAAGATRFWHYRSEEDALRDALRLSRTMTYKAALAGLPHGGGKAVIIGNPKRIKNTALLREYAQRVNLLGGNFYTGEDVGMDKKDVKIMAKETKYVIGSSPKSDNPPYWTALGTFYAMQAGLREVFGTSSLRGRTVAIKGIGKVGKELCRLLAQKGAKLVVADIDPEEIQVIQNELPDTRVVSPEEIHKEEVDVYSPCALSRDLTARVISELQCKLVCGCANNQLGSPRSGSLLHRRKIIYIPDYVANAGGLINVVDELNPKGYSRTRVMRRVRHIRQTAKKIIDLSKKHKRSPHIIADELAEKIFQNNNGSK